MKLQTSGVLGTSYAIAKLAPKREYQIFINDIVRTQSFKDAIVDVTSLYKTW